jgi:hypothetical protein
MEENLEDRFYDYNRMKKILKDFDPQLRKAMDREIRDFLKPLASEAKGLIPAASPLSGWAFRQPIKSDSKWGGYRRWDASHIASGINVRQGGKRFKGRAVVAMWRLNNRDAAGAIYELAGRKSRRQNAARQSLHRRYRRQGGHAVQTGQGKPGGPLRSGVSDQRAGGDRQVAKRVYAIADKYQAMLERAVNERGRLG